MSNPTELALGERAIRSGVTGCYEWDDKAAERVRSNPDLRGLTPEYIRNRLHEFVIGGGKVKQVREKRTEYSYREYWYKANIPEPGFKQGVFVEFELTDDDPDLPCVTLGNAHP